MTSARSHRDSGPLRRTGRAIGHALHTPFTGTAKGIRKATHAHGAGESGLGKLIELHAVNGAGDVMITVALASTVFFSVPTDEARGRVALYLAITMAPFTLLAPVIGPLLDHLPHGRRAAMAAAMLTRAVLALTMSGAVATGGLELYPAALGVLVCSKAYGVVRSAVVPRLLPPRFSLVKANSRVTLAGLLATGVAAPIGAGLHTIGSPWPLYGACVIFIGGTVLAFTLPHTVDSAKGERKARLVPTYGAAAPRPGTKRNGRTRGREKNGEKRPGLRSVGPSVLNGLQANTAHRALSGFLIFFLAFLLREQPLAGQSAAVSLGIVGVAAGAGNALGTAFGAWLRARGPEVIVASVLTLALGAAVLAALFFSTVMVAALSATAGFTQALSKLSLDAMIQRDVPEEVRTSAFARSETVLQMAWVVGGGIGIVLPLNGVLGMSVASGILALGAATSVRGLLVGARRGSPHPRVA
ncbi:MULTISPECIES: MFS transporter [unclassified Streptomyces]|uniref:MFS transporter n=1 Tax=unclassified Streptomyces TaxID=2593676 RepID=UPI002252EB5D|nr:MULTISPECIES: MFS transporter [unclassified Streptomyces]WSP56663.1 MFS transporter [Streptomyces sp. NBC_01241]WSU22619.1 MFS transporter [Streptomyces sp. NBC_01108]MCX4788410.1 MFS transporter [Streptomyces sp. NBC_01221]MCX4795829.1 MFS transporter [Streptomyces sp. NBC_01242]WSJ37111.1 MFS transporter [Streptomyces sp. NBC_01321]